jgi:hypothetical protein
MFKGTPRSWPARAQQGSNITKEHSRRPGNDAQEVRPSTSPSRFVHSFSLALLTFWLVPRP